MSASAFLLGIDLGSSSVKVSLVNAENGEVVADSFEPETEMPIHAEYSGWAEQDPEMWWKYTIRAIKNVLAGPANSEIEILAIGISYQMHGLVLLDKNGDVLRPSIIWCDSRAIDTGRKMEQELGSGYCRDNLLNSPGNFTAAKLRWVYENEPELYHNIDTFMLPGDYIAYRLTGDRSTTATGLSEGIFWDFRAASISEKIMEGQGFQKEMIPEIVPAFGIQGRLNNESATLIGLKEGIPISYRSGDQPNNALSLKVSEPGQVAATAGTSGVIYAITDKASGDPFSRVNTFLHPSVGYDKYGILLCVNGTGIANSWIRRISGSPAGGYERMNELAENIPVGSEGILFYPFGNGAERMLQNKQPEASFLNLSFTKHGNAHLYRAVQEGVCYALYYGFEVLSELGFEPRVIRASDANMFRSRIFCEQFSSLTGCLLEIYETDGARGAAMAAGVGIGLYHSMQEIPLSKKKEFVPDAEATENYRKLYHTWKKNLITKLLS